MSTRYCYIVKSTKNQIVGVWSGREEAIQAAIDEALDSGIIEYKIEDVNDSYVYIKPIKYDSYNNVEIERYVIQ